MHTPVFLEQVMQHVYKQTDTRYIDATLGEGGHTRALAQAGLKVLALDADQEQIDAFMTQDIPDSEMTRITAVQGNFAFVTDIAHKYGFTGVDGIIFDLGLSMNQIHRDRGFSYKHLHQPLDMVLDTVAKQRGTARAADVVAQYSYEELVVLFEQYAERIYAKQIARSIVNYRVAHTIATVGDLVSAVGDSAGAHEIPAIFQSIRMEVNEEIACLKLGLAGALDVVRLRGTIQVIAFHSVEDRVVKLWARKAGLREITKYVGREISDKDFEQSAIMRVFER